MWDIYRCGFDILQVMEVSIDINMTLIYLLIYQCYCLCTQYQKQPSILGEESGSIIGISEFW